MNKNQWLKIVNLLLFCSFLILAITGMLLFFNLFAFKSELFAALHEYAGFTFVILAIFHLILNWSWVRASFFRKK